MSRTAVQNKTWIYVFLGITFLGLLGAATSLLTQQQSKRSSLKTVLEPLPQHSLIKVYMNQQQATRFVDFRGIDRYGDDQEQVILDFIGSANRSIDVAVQELRLPKVARALVAKHRSGVKVRLVIENTYSRGWSEFTTAEGEKLDPHRKERFKEFLIFADANKDGQLSRSEAQESDAIYIIKTGGVSWIDDTEDGSKGSGLMHHKFIVTDQQKVLFGSTNFTPSDAYGDADNESTRGNSNNLVVIEHQGIAQLFTEEFNYLWGDGPGGQKDSLFGVNKPHRPPRSVPVADAEVKIKFSPDSKTKVSWEETSNGFIAATIAKAQRSVDMALFVFAEPKIGNLLEEKQQQGVQIAALVDSSFAYRNFATTLDMWGYVSTQDCKSGNQRPWSTPIPGRVGIASIAKGDKLHHKFGLIDDETVITGSHNWSSSANYNNDETIVTIQNPTVAAHYRREFDRLFADAKTGPSPKIEREGVRVCSDLKKTTKKSIKKNTETAVSSEDQGE